MLRAGRRIDGLGDGVCVMSSFPFACCMFVHRMQHDSGVGLISFVL